MDEQPLSNNKQAQFKVFTSAIMNAIGVGSSEQGEKFHSINIFLSKIYKKNVSSKQSKLNQIRLRRLNAFFYKIVHNLPKQRQAFDIIVHTIVGFLCNSKNFEHDTDPITLKTGHWISKILDLISSTQHFQYCLEIFQMLANNKAPIVLSEQNFEELVKNNQSFVNQQIKKEDQINANKRTVQFSMFQEVRIKEYILKQINCETFFSNLFQRSEEKQRIIDKFLEYCEIINVDSVKEKFIDIFVKDKLNDQNIVEAVLKGAESNIFDIGEYDSIVKRVFKETENNRNILFKLKLKELKCESRYLELIMEQIKGKSIVEMVQCFINSTQINNYYLLYLINKSTQKIPESFTNLIFHPQKFTNRHAIICVFSIFQNQHQYKKLLQQFFVKEEKLNPQQKVNVLKLIQFSLQVVTKAYLFSQILRKVPASELDLQSKLQFLPIYGQQKINISKDEKQQVSELLNRYFGNTQTIYKIKLDLYPVCGKAIPYLPDLQTVVSLFDKPTQTILAELPNIKEEILEVALMGINNKIKEQFMTNQSITQNTVDWALNLHKKEMKKFVSNIELELKRLQKSEWQHLVIALFEYNFERGTDLSLDESVNPITSLKMIQSLKGNDFSEYFISLYSEKVQKYSSLMKPKSILIELRKLLRILPNAARQNTKKQLKTILFEESPALYALKIIHNITTIGIRTFQSNENVKQILRTMLKQLKPQYEYFDELQRRIGGVYIDYHQIYETIPELLKEIHTEAIKFTADLMSSKIPILDEKKKKIKRKTDSNEIANDQQKLLGIISKEIQNIFGDPNTFDSYENLLKIINKISTFVKKEQLSKELIHWLSNLKIFHRDSFKEWKKKVMNLANLWQIIVNLISGIISVEEKERHFLIVTDLLNTLYELYRKQENMMEVEQMLLQTLLLIFRLKCNDNMQMQEDEIKFIPDEKLRSFLSEYHQAALHEPHYFECVDCNHKKICNLESDFIHRLHDKIYTGTSGSCEHGGKAVKSEKDEKEERREAKQKQIKERYMAIKQLRQRDKHVERQRDLERFTLSRFMEGQNVAQAQQIMFQLQIRQKMLDAQRLQELELKRGKQSQFSYKVDQEEEDKKEYDENKVQIRSCSEKQFLIHRQVIKNQKQNVLPSAYEERTLKNSKYNINLNPLFKLLTRELTANNFLTLDQLQTISKKDNQDPTFKVDIEVNKLIFFKNDVFKAQQSNQLPYNSAYGSYRAFNSESLLPKRNVISMSDKHIVINAGQNVLAFSFPNLKSKYSKKESEKKYRQVEPYEGYLLNRNSNSQNPIMQISFSPHTKNILAVVAQSRLTFEVYNGSDGRIQKVFGGQHNYGRIQKFEWIKGGKNMFAVLNRQINFGLVHKSLQIRRLSRIQINRTCKDFAISIGSKGANVILLDVDGKLYQSNFQIHDITHNQTHNISQKIVNMPPITQSKIVSIYLYEQYLMGILRNGSVAFFDVQENGSISTSPTIVPIVQKFINTQAAVQYPKLKQFNLLTNLKVIHKTANELFFTCLLSKDQYSPEMKNNGNFMIWKYNIKKKKSNIVVYNDQGMTQSYDFASSGDKEWLIFCLQDDGQIWSTKFSPIKTSIHDDEYKLQMSNKLVTDYAKDFQNFNILDKIIEYENERKYIYKVHNVITEYFQIETNENVGWKVKYADQYNYCHFISGISFCVDYPQNQSQSFDYSFSCLGKQYFITVQKNRQVQIPFTLKQTLQVFFKNQPLQIKFNNSRNFVVKNFTIYGSKWDEKTVYFNILQQLCKLYTIYIAYSENETQTYLLNEARTDIDTISIQELVNFMNKKKYNRAEINLLMKLQLLRQSVTTSLSLNTTQLKQFYSHIRSGIVPFCSDKKVLYVSVQKLCQKLTKVTQLQNNKSIKIGHPLHYQTHFDIHEIFTKYGLFVSEQTLQTYEALIKKLIFLMRERVNNFYLLIACWPKLIDQISFFYRKIIGEYKNYFKVSDKGMDRNDKAKMVRLCKNLVLLICETYYIQKNRGNKQAEKELLKQFESIFCITNRQFYKELYLNPFQFIQSVWESQSYSIDAPFNYFGVPPFKEELYIQNVQYISSPVPLIEQEINNPPPQRSIFADYDGEGEIDEEQHKIAQQENRQMQQEEEVQFYGQQVGDLKVEEMVGQQNMQQQKNDINSIYDNLYNQLQDKQSVWCTLYLNHAHLCENMILFLFEHQNYLTQQNAVFYMGMLYNLLLIMENRSVGSLDHIFKVIDNRIFNPNYSVLFMALNMFVEVSYIEGVVVGNTTKICKLLIEYYQTHPNSNFIKCITSQVNWESNSETFDKPVSLNSVITLQIFNINNQAYELKFIGNLYLNLSIINFAQFKAYEQQIKSFVLKAVVKYNLRVYKNIMLTQDWTSSLEETKVDVAFERILKNKNKRKAVEMIKECVQNSLSVYVSGLKLHPERVQDLENLLGSGEVEDQQILDLLDAFYSKDQ